MTKVRDSRSEVSCVSKTTVFPWKPDSWAATELWERRALGPSSRSSQLRDAGQFTSLLQVSGPASVKGSWHPPSRAVQRTRQPTAALRKCVLLPARGSKCRPMFLAEKTFFFYFF